MTHFDELSQRYRENGIRDEQLDGTGAEPGSAYATRNYVALGVLTQAQANAIRASAQDPAVADMQAAINIYEGGQPDGTI